MSDLAKRKRDARAARKAERDYDRRTERLQRRCFWTWPFGHAWEGMQPAPGYVLAWKCAGCGKQRHVEVGW